LKKLVFAFLALALVSPLAHAQSAHDVQLTAILATSCNTATPCYTEIYRLTASGPTAACSATVASYTLIASSLLGTTVTNTGSTTVYDDQDPALTTGSSYCYTATVHYLASTGGESGMSPTVLVTFPLPPSPPSALTALIKK
jgi:hypothetical protein